MWDNWLNEHLPATRYRARKRYSLDSPLIEYDTRSLNEQIPAVCTECNCGWMSGLTARIKERFAPAMLEGEAFSLNANDAALFAAFTFMKAVVTNHTSDDHEPFFMRAARERLRTSLVVPPATKMWTARYAGDAKMSTKSNFGVFSREAPGPLYGIEFGSFTYVVGKLAVQLLTPRWKQLHDRGKPVLSLTPNAYWEQATIQFWPHEGELISWPPPQYIGDDVMPAFIQRFGDPVNVPIA